MKFIFTFIIALFIATTIHAQSFQWAKSFTGNSNVMGASVTTDAMGNVYTTGHFNLTADFDPGPGIFNLVSSGSYDVFISKTDGNGNFIWAKKIGGTLSESASSLKIDAAGNIYLTGAFAGTCDFDTGPGVFNLVSAGGDDIFIAKLDNNGDFIWAKNMGGASTDRGETICLDASGNIYTAGSFNSTADFDPGPGVFNLVSGGGNDIFIIKLDGNGNFNWAKKMGGTGTDGAVSICLDVSGNIYTTGYFNSTADFDPGPAAFNLVSAGQEDIFISKLDGSGNFIWAKRIGEGPYDDYANSMAIDATGNIIITGSFNNTVDFDPGPGVFNLTNGGVFICKLDGNGNFVWAKAINAVSGESITIDGVGNVYLIGNFYNPVDFDPGPGVFNLVSAGQGDIFISKFDANGNFAWAKRMGGPLDDYGYSIIVDAAGYIYSTGSYLSSADFDPGPNIYLLSSPFNGIQAFVLKLDDCGIPANTINVDMCDSTVINGVSYTNTGYYIQFFNSVNGCDSNTIYHTIKHNTTYNYPTVIACDSFTLGNQTYTNTGVYNQTLISPWGCDSNITLNLTIKHSSANTITQTACNSYTLNGQTYTSSGVYTQTLNNAVGCDSVITLNLTINYSSGIALTATSCGPYTLNGQTYNTSGVYTQTYINAVGCDSVVTLNLTVHQPTAFTINQSACVTYTLNGQTYTSSGTYTQTLVNAAGCDSVITLNLTINQPTANTITQTACGSYTLNAQTYTTSGTYTQTLVNAANCDSVITLNVTINQPSTNTLTQTACNSYTLNGQTYTSSGTYTQTLVNAVNCDSVLTLNLTINAANISVTQAGALLTANATPATYQWLRCNPFQDIPGEINQTFTATANGDYAVAVTQNGCTDTSACYTVVGIGINDYLQLSNILLYPNPVTQRLFIETEKAFQNATLKILNIAGQTVTEQNNISEKKFEIDMSKLVSGTYFVEITDGGYKYVRVVTKE